MSSPRRDIALTPGAHIRSLPALLEEFPGISSARPVRVRAMRVGERLVFVVTEDSGYFVDTQQLRFELEREAADELARQVHDARPRAPVPRPNSTTSSSRNSLRPSKSKRSAAPATAPAAPVQQKRGRGRPRKVQPDLSRASTLDVVDACTSSRGGVLCTFRRGHGGEHSFAQRGELFPVPRPALDHDAGVDPGAHGEP